METDADPLLLPPSTNAPPSVPTVPLYHRSLNEAYPHRLHLDIQKQLMQEFIANLCYVNEFMLQTENNLYHNPVNREFKSEQAIDHALSVSRERITSMFDLLNEGVQLHEKCLLQMMEDWAIQKKNNLHNNQ